MISKCISWFFVVYISLCSALGTPVRGYAVRELLGDAGFQNGFVVLAQQTDNGQAVPLGVFSGNQDAPSPAWMIAQWNSGPCLWRDRMSSDPYTITDGATKSVVYSPRDKSVTLTLHGESVYHGSTADYESPFPHLLLEQAPFPDDAEACSCDAAHILWSCDLRMREYLPTTNPDGVNAVQFLVYFYVKGKQTNEYIWFGANLYDDRGLPGATWARDTAGSEQMIYAIGAKDVFGTARRSLNSRGVSDRWTHVALDLAPYLDDLVDTINTQNVFGRRVSRSDFTLGGMNIGFEVHGNAGCSIELRDMRLRSYVSARG